MSDILKKLGGPWHASDGIVFDDLNHAIICADADGVQMDGYQLDAAACAPEALSLLEEIFRKHRQYLNPEIDDDIQKILKKAGVM